MREHLGDKLDAYLDGSLDEASRREVEAHVKGCPGCARELQSTRALAARIDEAKPAEAPKSSFKSYWDRLLGRHGEVKTMTATQRLKRVVHSNVHAAIDAMEDPAKMIRQLLREMQDALAGARDELAESMALEIRLTRRAEAAEAESKSWDEKAALALRKGREDLARESLDEKLSQAALGAELRDEAAKQKIRVAQLRSAFDRLSRQFEELNRRKPMWLARARNSIGTAGSKEAYRAAYAELSRIVGESEERADVDDALAQLQRPASLDETLGELSRLEILEKEFQELKKRVQN